jgi:outer membrane assembly lipoprotein YfiO
MRVYSANKIISIIACSALIGFCASVFIPTAYAYWIWTPETKKFINPKYAVKDSPKEQFDWAMSFYDAKDYKRAATEFDKLPKHYEFSNYAPRAQYYAGLSNEQMGKYYIAFQAYQKTIDNFPHVENLDEINEHEFKIANIYAEKPNPKILGTDIMTSTDRALEIYKKVVENAPFGPLADEAQFKMGETLKRAGMFEEATLAFQRIVDEYPTSRFAEKAQYEVAQCAYKASLRPAYDAGPTDRALRIFEEYAASSTDEKLSEEAKKTMQRLKNRAAEKSMMVAKFYEQQRHPKSAIIYYQDVLDRFPDSIQAPIAQAKIEELQSVKTPVPGGILGWFAKPAAPAAPPVAKPVEAKKKGWWPFRFGKEESPAAEAVGVPAPIPQAVPAAVPAAGVSAPVAMVTPPQTIPASIAQTAKKGWDFLGLLGTPEPPPPPRPAAVNPGDPPVTHEEKGSARANPITDDPNLDFQDDII